MMKTYSLLISLTLLISFSGISQNNVQKIHFEDGSTKLLRMIYDDPFHLPKWQLEYSIFGFTVQKDGALVFQLKPVFRFNEKFMVDCQITMPYSKGLDFNIHQNKKDYPTLKRSFDISLLSHYRFATRRKVKNKWLAVSFGPGVVYKAKMNRNVASYATFISGLNAHRLAYDYNVKGEDNNDSDTTYSLGTGTTYSVCAGLGWSFSESYKLNTDGVVMKFWRSARIYGFVSYAFASKERYLRENYYDDIVVHDPPESEFDAMKLDRFGYRVGIDLSPNIVNSNVAITYGFEFGRHASYVTSADNTIGTSQSMFMVHFGFSFGEKL